MLYYLLLSTTLIFPLTLIAALSGFITQDTAFTIANSPYSIDGDIFISDGITVKIDPGVTFQFKANTDVMQSGDYSDKSEIVVYGTIVCEGKPDSIITFKSYFGSNIAGEWGQIKTDLQGKIFIQYTNIRYSTNGINIYKSASMDIRIENCKFQNIESDAIKITSSNVNRSYIGLNEFESVERAVYSSRSFTDCSFNSITNSTNGIETENNSIITSNNLNNLSGWGFKISCNCIVEDNKINGISEIAIFLLGGNCKVINNEIININQNGIELIESSNNSISGNIFKNVDGEGISIIDVHDYYNAGSDNIIKNNLIYQCSNGIKINHLHSTNNLIKYNTITNCSNGIYAYDNANAVYNYCESRNNIIVSNYSYGIYSVPNNGQFNSDYDNVWSNGNNYDPWITPGNNNISVNPYFSNPDVNDFTLQEGSPCLVMGENGGQMGAYGGFRQYNHSPSFDFINLNGNDLYSYRSIVIQWTASDPDTDDVYIYLFWDIDTDTTDMTGIELNLSNTGSYTWNTSRMIPGSYYIHAVAYDYKLGRTSQYSSAQIIITHDSNTESTPTNLTAYPSNQAVTLNWESPLIGIVNHYIIYQSTVSGFYPTESDSIGESITTSSDVSGLTNGTTYYYRVAARKTDGNLTGFSNSVSVTPQAITMQVGSGSSAPGAEVSIPVSVTDITGLGVISYQFKITYNTSFLNLVSVSTTDCITSDWSVPSVNIGDSTVIIWHSGATELVSSGNLVNLEFTVNTVASPGDSTELRISDVLVNEGDPGFNFFNGWYSVYPAFTISGIAQYYMGDHFLEGVSIILSGAQSGNTTTNVSGEYSLPSVQGGWSYEVTASDTGILSQAISAYDAALILRHIAQLDTLEDNQLIAADVSGDGTASSTDAANIGQWGVGLINDFPSGKSWYFAPDIISIDPLTQDTLNIDFTGIAYGDVSGNWDCVLAKLAEYPFVIDETRPLQVDTPDEYIFSLSEPKEVQIDGDDYIIYDLNVNTTRGILAFTFKFLLGGGEKDYVEFLPSSEFTNHISASNYKENQFIITSAGIYPSNEDKQEIGQILLNKSAPDPWGDLVLIYAEANEKSTSYTYPTAIQENVENIPEDFRLYQNYPNPFNNNTVIEYDIPVNTEVSLKIFDLQGRLVKKLVNNLTTSPGKYIVVWNGTNDRNREVPSGLYFFQINSNEYSDVKKLLLIK